MVYNTSFCPIRLSIQEDASFPSVKVYDRRSSFEKVKSIAVIAFHLIQSILRKISKRFSSTPSYFSSAIPVKSGNAFSYDEKTLPWADQSESSGLYLFLHGLRGHPLDWDHYAKNVKEKDSKAHLFAPFIPEKGNCPLETAAKPLIPVLENYLKKFPGKPVVLIGTSNGGRIAAYLETHLNENVLKNSPLCVVSLAGVHYGTKMVSGLKKIGLLPLLGLHKDLADEFMYGSRFAKESLEQWRKKQDVWSAQGAKVRHLFCATLGDEQVRDISCSLPLVGKEDGYLVFQNQSHVGIVDGARKQVFDWIDSFFLHKKCQAR